uniref:Uncharacterized protein n=1 Tax=Rhizophora mucronata TaxID=61149 RepID=A0A2P2PC34_RHIMU
MYPTMVIQSQPYFLLKLPFGIIFRLLMHIWEIIYLTYSTILSLWVIL